MSSSNDEDTEVLNPEGTRVRRRTHAGPWRNKQEFDAVYDWIYGENSSRETKERACRQMTIWKLRRLNLTPGTILSTRLILEAELKDETYSGTNERAADMCAIYATVFTRFLNYMAAISHTSTMKTMYATARELNLDPFLVDLRHLCAHGHSMPNIEVFRRASKYCLNWLREFYWSAQKETMVDVDAKNVRHKSSTNFDENVREMFLVYDAANEALSKQCIKVADTKNCLSSEKVTILKLFANKTNEISLKTLNTLALKRISKLVKRGHKLKDLSQIFLDALLAMSHFFEEGHDIKNEADEKSLVARHQSLFRTMALNGFIEDLYYLLVEIAENEYENVIRRKGASFWAKQIAIGFIAFKKIKMVYKRQLEENSDEKLSLSTVNEKFVARNVLEVYEDYNIDVKGTLIFGDTIKCPWALSFSRQYIMERIEHINEYTEEMIKSCLQLVEPPLSDEESANLIFLIDQYVGDKSDTLFENSLSEKVFTLQEHVLKNKMDDVEMTNLDSDAVENQTTFGIWTQVSDGQDWSSCPLGRLMWE